MSVRYYISKVYGDGQTLDTPFRPAVIDLVPSVQWNIHDCRPDDTQQEGTMLVWGDVDAAQHAILAVHLDVTYIPFEDESGNPLTVNDHIGDIDPVKRGIVQTAMENRHIPIQGLTLDSEIYVILLRYKSRCRIRQWLMANDYTESLDDKISTVPAVKRQAIEARLTELGFDLSGINGNTLIRDALVALIIQDVTI